jgi:hypothetical protein
MKTGKYIISGYVDGQKFRPSNWAERVCEAGARFDPKARIMRYSEHLHPRQCDDYGCSIFVNFDALEAEIANYISWFVDSNRLDTVALQPVLVQETAAVEETAKPAPQRYTRRRSAIAA